MTDDDLPSLFADADDAAKRGQRRYFAATRATLVAGVISAIFGAMDLRDGATDWAAIVATAAFGAAILIGVYLLADHPEREWYEGRAAAESAKTLAWRYAAGSSDFATSTPDEHADREFLSRLGEIAKGLHNVRLGRHPNRGEITETMRDLRRRPFATRRDVYRSDRIRQQQVWYRQSAERHGRAATAWRVASLLAQLLGLIGGLLKATGAINFDLLGVAAAAGAAAIAWLATREHGTLASAYSNTARELAIVDSELAYANEKSWPAAVENAELAISREHTLWRARRTEAAD